MSSGVSKGKTLKRANPSTIQDKFLVGYQGWFTCAGDGEPLDPAHHGWLHWFNHPIKDGGRPNTDLWPDVSEYSPSELFPTGLKFADGEQPFVFSSRHPKTVQRHFHWMAKHGIDGAFLQRFAGQTDLEAGSHGIRRLRDEIGDRVREAAELEGRVFAIMYDVSGVPPDRIQRVLEHDWAHLVRSKSVLDSPNYLREKGRAVVALWGFGFEGSHHSPATIRAITAFFRNTTPGGVYIIAGTPSYWRTSMGDADRNPEHVNVWLNDFDAISPWSVGRYGNELEADRFTEEKTKGDVELLRKRNEEGSGRKVDYIPVVFPGGSGFNLSEGKWAFNDIKRNGGKFLWRQIFNARRQGVRIMYGAMWDEYDEGTALMPVVTKKKHVPKSDKWEFLALDEDGFDLPSDWYMRICGFAAEGLRSERRIHESFPSKELQDYWSNRPKYEETDDSSKEAGAGSGAGSGGGEGQSYEDWLATQKEEKDEPPPPPYSLEAEEAEAAAQQQQTLSPAPATVSGVEQPRADPSSRDSNSRPQSQPLLPQPQPGSGPSAALAASTVPISQLTDAFGRQTISPTGLAPGPSPPASSPTAGQQSFAPSPNPGPSHTPQATTPGTPHEPQSQGSWSQAQWPPPEWKQQQRPFGRPPQHPQVQQGKVRPPAAVGFKPYSSTPATSSRPRPPSAPPPTGAPPPSAVRPPVPQQEPALPHVYPGEFPPAHMVQRPPSAGPSYPGRPHQPSPPLHGPQNNASMYGNPSTPYEPCPGGPQFPQAPSPPGGYYGPSNGPQHQHSLPPHQPHPQPYQPYQPRPQTSHGTRPSYNAGQPDPTGPSSAFPGPGCGYPAPNIPSGSYYGGTPSPPQPAAHAPYGQSNSSAPSFPSATAPAPAPAPAPPSGPLGFALNSAADTLGLGEGPRRHLEKAALTGNKLINKFF